MVQPISLTGVATMTSKHINTNVYDRDAILASLEKLHLSGMLLALKQQCDRPEIATLTFETRLGMLLHEEIERRRTNRIQRLIHDSGLSNREGANIEGVIYNGQRNLDEGLIQELAQCHGLTVARVPSVLITGVLRCLSRYLSGICDANFCFAQHKFVHAGAPLAEGVVKASRSDVLTTSSAARAGCQELSRHILSASRLRYSTIS